MILASVPLMHLGLPMEGDRPVSSSGELPPSASSGTTPDRSIVTPVARALSILAAFAPRNTWLGNRDLATRSGLPASTVSRMAKSLATLGYLQYAPDQRKYRLAARVLGLGYATVARSDAQRMVRAKMQSFAEQYGMDVTLWAHDGLSMIVLEICSSTLASNALRLHVGARICLGSSPVGWALLAALPAVERYDLLDNVQRRMQRERLRLLRGSCTAIAQAQERGFCTSLGEGDGELGIVAAPLSIAGHAPLVLACSGSSSQMRRTRMEHELGPRLVAIAMELRQESLAGPA